MQLEAWPSSPARSRETILVTDFWPRPGQMATAEELREAVLWTGALIAFTPTHFVGQLFHSHLIYIARKTWIGWLAWLLALLVAGASHAARNLSKNGRRDRPAAWMPLFSGAEHRHLSNNGWSPVVAISGGNNFFPGSLSHLVHVLWHPSNGTGRSLRLHCKRPPNMAGSLLFQNRFYEVRWLTRPSWCIKYFDTDFYDSVSFDMFASICLPSDSLYSHQVVKARNSWCRCRTDLGIVNTRAGIPEIQVEVHVVPS